ncbi:nitroreductase family protein [Nocardia blacklockiae]|uniref:nitroreductase family protein n=1 Tax=Nocardia blacklockiae TaxID=480036 RepID=UPI001895238D|nr:nitroreductase family protein [Nocardia blacklockiae]MBF6175071.1 nitroreductase family protein [Nocardia blacklockiae]
MELDLTADELLSTTRAVRKRLDLDRPVPREVVRECIELAVQAPSGSNRQGWHWVVVTDAEKRRGLGELYRRGFEAYAASPEYPGNRPASDPEADAVRQRVAGSAAYLAERMGEVPVLIVPCLSGRVDNAPSARSASFWASLFPAVWSFCLAARSRGLGTAWTTLHLGYEREAADLLGIPYEQVSQGALLPLAYTKGTRFKPAARNDLDGIVHFDSW